MRRIAKIVVETVPSPTTIPDRTNPVPRSAAVVCNMSEVRYRLKTVPSTFKCPLYLSDKNNDRSCLHSVSE